MEIRVARWHLTVVHAVPQRSSLCKIGAVTIGFRGKRVEFQKVKRLGMQYDIRCQVCCCTEDGPVVDQNVVIG